jgi:hypothetical protein
MQHTRHVIAALFIVSAAAVGACSREEPEAPPAQVQSQSVQQTNSPTNVTGCLKAGDAANTFVLTTAQSVDGTPAATYQLHGSAGVNLIDHVGTRIEVSGIVREQAQIATREAARPADDKAAGTAGTPTVQTTTTLSIKQLDVTGVKQSSGDCQM